MDHQGIEIIKIQGEKMQFIRAASQSQHSLQLAQCKHTIKTANGVKQSYQQISPLKFQASWDPWNFNWKLSLCH